MNELEARYCIHCGTIIKPIFCSFCGAVNPVDLANCLECGNRLPNVSEMNWDELAIRENEVESTMLGEPKSGRKISSLKRILSLFRRKSWTKSS